MIFAIEGENKSPFCNKILLMIGFGFMELCCESINSNRESFTFLLGLGKTVRMSVEGVELAEVTG